MHNAALVDEGPWTVTTTQAFPYSVQVMNDLFVKFQ